MTMTAFDLTTSELYVLNEARKRASDEGYVYLPPPNAVWQEKLEGLVTKGFLRQEAHDVWELVT